MLFPEGWQQASAGISNLAGSTILQVFRDDKTKALWASRSKCGMQMWSKPDGKLENSTGLFSSGGGAVAGGGNCLALHSSGNSCDPCAASSLPPKPKSKGGGWAAIVQFHLHSLLWTPEEKVAVLLWSSEMVAAVKFVCGFWLPHASATSAHPHPTPKLRRKVAASGHTLILQPPPPLKCKNILF